MSLASFEPRPLPAAPQAERMARRWRIIEEAAAFPPRSAERAAAVKVAADRHGESLRTIQRWLSDFDALGGDVSALARRRPGNAGAKRVHVSRQFDKAFVAAGHPLPKLEELGRRVDELARAVWASPVQRSGWYMVRRAILTSLQRECRERGLAMPDRAFHLSRRRISGEAEEYRRVDIYKNDRKRFDDQKPRIRRDWSKTQPMETIVADVKPLDIVMRRPDGSEAWPKMIAFMDAGTHRIFPHFVLLPKGEGVRREHVIEAFLAMVAHPEWGFPQQLYLDNGSEFTAFEKIRGALELVQTPGERTIIHARPYSGASKPIESKFATLDRLVFCQMQGWAGGNRMNKKTQTVGKPPKPFPGSIDDFRREALVRLLDFESVPIRSGSLAGRSPAEIYADYVSAGWRPIACNRLALDSAFCDRITRRVERGALSIDGDRYRHPELPNGRTVSIALPWRRGAWPLVDLPELGWAYLEPEMAHLPGDISGAIESGRLQRREARAIGAIGRRAAGYDPAVNIGERVTTLPTRAAPAPLIDILMSSEAEALATARIEADQRQLAAPSEAERRRAHRMALTEALEASFARKHG